MSALGRVVLGFLSLVWVAACGGLIALAWNGDRKLDIDFADFDLEAFIVAGDAEKWFFTVILGLAAVLGVLAFLLAFRRTDRAPRGSLRLKQADGGTVEVTAAALESLVAAEMLELPDVHTAKARVRLQGHRVTTDLDLGIGGQVSIANTTAAAGTKLNEVFRDQVGVVDVRRPLVRIAHSGEPMRVERSTAPLPPPPLADRRLSYDAPQQSPPPPPSIEDTGNDSPAGPPPQTSTVTLPPPPSYPSERRNDDD